MVGDREAVRLVAYALQVVNAGRGRAGPFDVLLSVSGPDLPAQRVTGLDSGDSTTLLFAAPRCAQGSTVRIAVDARGEIGEVDERDDVVERTCPLAG